jgi:hypothetical protein
VTETLIVETSTLVAIILEEPGWRQVAEQIVGASAFTTCFNVCEAALAVVREKDPSAAHVIVRNTTARLDVEMRDYASQAILLAIGRTGAIWRSKTQIEHGRLLFLRSGERTPGPIDLWFGDAANAPRAPSRRNRRAAAPRRRALGPTAKIHARLSTGFWGGVRTPVSCNETGQGLC